MGNGGVATGKTSHEGTEGREKPKAVIAELEALAPETCEKPPPPAC